MSGAKEQLAQLTARINHLTALIPPRAGAFHAMCADLLTEIANVGRFTLLFNEGARLEEFGRKGHDIEELAVVLSPLLTECDALRDRTLEIETLAKACPDTVVAAAGQERLAAARTSLAALGVNSRSTADVASAWDQVRLLGQRIEGEARVFPLFTTSARVHQALSELDDLSAGVLAADLERWRKDYLDGTPAGGWIAAAEAALEEYRKKAEARKRAIAAAPPAIAPGRAQELPPTRLPNVSLFAVEALLSECRQWADALDGHIDAVQPLMAQKRQLLDGASAPPERVEALYAAAAALRDDLRARVAADGARRMQSLRRRVGLFTEVCGPDEELNVLLNSLEGPGAQSSEEYEQFSSALHKAEAKFGGTANVEQEKLHESLLERCQSQRAKIVALRKLRRPLDAENELVELQRLVPTPPFAPPPADESLQALELCLDLEGRLEAVRLQSGVASRALDEDVAAANQRHLETGRLRELLGLAASEDFETAGRLLDEATSWPPDAIVDDCRERLKILDAHGAREERACEIHFKALVERDVAHIRDAERELTRANRMLDQPFTPPAQAGSTAARIGTIQTLAGYRSRIEGALNQGCAGFREAAEGMRRKLQAIAESGAQDANREIAIQLLEEAELLPAEDPRASVQTFRILRSWVQQGETFFYTLERELNEVRQKVTELKARLHSLRRQSRNIYHPSLFERAAAMVGGAALGFDSPAGSMRQLEEAELMLQALEVDSLRCLVVEITEGSRELRDQILQSRDAAFVKNSQRVLEDLAGLDPADVPPLALRRELALLLRRPVGALRRRP